MNSGLLTPSPNDGGNSVPNKFAHGVAPFRTGPSKEFYTVGLTPVSCLWEGVRRADQAWSSQRDPVRRLTEAVMITSLRIAMVARGT